MIKNILKACEVFYTPVNKLSDQCVKDRVKVHFLKNNVRKIA